MNLSIDIGGTKIRFALVENNKILKADEFLNNTKDYKWNILKIQKKFEEWNSKIDFIGIACPGPLNIKDGIIINSPNLDDWNGKNLKTEFKNIMKIDDIRVNNDANVAALGQFNIRKNLDSLVYFTISTGIGCGFINKGEIYNGFSETACEIANDFPDLSIGKNKTGIEFFASGLNIVKKLSSLGVVVSSAKEAFSLLKTNSNKIVNEYFLLIKDKLITMLSTAIYFLNPEIIVLGGSVALNNKEWFLEIFRDVLEVTQDINYKTKLEFALNLDDSTLIGCSNL